MKFETNEVNGRWLFGFFVPNIMCNFRDKKPNDHLPLT